MTELSLHILDIAQNAVSAGATLIEIKVYEDLAADALKISVKDNGRGMEKELLEKVTEPFVTTRTTRGIGLGIPLFKAAAERAGGKLTIHSEVGKGTEVIADFVHSHIDRQPLGNLTETILGLIAANGGIDFLYVHRKNEKSFSMDTREIKEQLSGVPITEPEVLNWILGYLEEGERELV